MPTEGLAKIYEGTRDIAVGISGFGSAKLPFDRWEVLGELTGRTTFVLQYDAQQMPWETVPKSLLELAKYGPEVRRRWVAARLAAAGVSQTLATWIERWTSAGRKVLVVGFSLGGYVAWRAAREAPSELVDAILISAAIGDKPNVWRNVDEVGHLVNVYSSKDAVLRHLYPLAVGSDETPAAGLGPLTVMGPNIDNIDATDLIGSDHLWASEHLQRLVRLALGCLWGTQSILGTCPSIEDLQVALEEDLPQETYARLLRWTVVDGTLWATLAKALTGDVRSIALCRYLDDWSLQGNRLQTLTDLGAVARALAGSTLARTSARRSLKELSGMLRMWIEAARVYEDSQLSDSRFQLPEALPQTSPG